MTLLRWLCHIWDWVKVGTTSAMAMSITILVWPQVRCLGGCKRTVSSRPDGSQPPLCEFCAAEDGKAAEVMASADSLQSCAIPLHACAAPQLQDSRCKCVSSAAAGGQSLAASLSCKALHQVRPLAAPTELTCRACVVV